MVTSEGLNLINTADSHMFRQLLWNVTSIHQPVLISVKKLSGMDWLFEHKRSTVCSEAF